MDTSKKNVVALAALVSALIAAPDAHALPTLGAPCPPVRLEDAWNRPLDLATLVGKPILVVYEDKDSATQNQALKDELSQMAKGDGYHDKIALVAVADVSSYDYWPVKGLVKSSIRGESRKLNTVIYCDWDGAVRQKLSLQSGASNIVLYGRNGRVLFAQSGALVATERKTIVELLRQQLAAR